MNFISMEAEDNALESLPELDYQFGDIMGEVNKQYARIEELNN